MKEFIKNNGMILIMLVLFLVCGVLGALTFTGCKSTIKMPEGLNDKCKVTWALIIAFHESNKNEATKSAIALLLNDSQKECYKSIDQERIRKVSVKCRKEVYGESPIDLRDLSKKDQFTSCVQLYEGEIK